jgi:TRAP-type C4-dicarboxylate transport system substrate-binding protein
MTSHFSYHCAHDIESSSSLNRLLQTLWDEVARDSGGRLSVALHPDGAAGGPDEMVDKLLDNRIQFHAVSGMIMSRLVPVIAVEGLAFAYGSSTSACEAMAGRTGDVVRAALRDKGVHAFRSVLPQGLNQIITRGRKVENASDLDGLRIRIGNSPYLKDLYGSLGCDPQPVDLQQVTAALRDGQAEGVEMPCYAILPADRHEYLDHVGEIGIRFACFWLCANLEAWNALGPEIQSIIERRFEVLAKDYARDLDTDNDRSRRLLEERGYTFTRVDRASLERRLHANGFYERWRARLGEAAWRAVQDARSN